MKCDFCDQPATRMTGSMNGVLACDEHAARFDVTKERVVTVTRADVYAARTRVRLDKILDRETPEWIKQLAETDIDSPGSPR